ncbi:MAG: U32 family peptidase [Chloroflexota bacterium]
MNQQLFKQKPELLTPAKNLERLQVAVGYGANAVYVGGQKYGLRARADNFTDTELAKAAAFAHNHDAKLYVTLNAFLHDDDFAGLASYCGFLESIGVDAVIVSDLGVMKIVRASSNLNVHVSTQASCLNVHAAHLWKKMGAKRLIVGRELSVAEAGKIQREAGIEIEMFVHGAMCMSYSGHCTISNFTAGRDSNRGGCSQSCRFPYEIEGAKPLQVEEEKKGITFMSSKDLWGIDHIGEFFDEGICSLKIEGRMKSSFYVASTCKAYRQLIDGYAKRTISPTLMQAIAHDLQAVPHRDYTSASLESPAGPDSVYGKLDGINRGNYQYTGIVLDTTPDRLVMRTAMPLSIGDHIEILPFQQKPIRWQVDQLFNIVGEPIQHMRQDSVACLPKTDELDKVKRMNVVRMAERV